MEDKRKKEIKKQIDPIIDGDARPDINLNPEEKTVRNHPIETPQDRLEKDSEASKEDKKEDAPRTTVNRADTDTLEDFKDAK